jgi:hypothetical protein
VEPALTIDRWKIFQLFKYAVYLLLAMNVWWFFAEEFAAARVQFPDGVGLEDLIEAYAATIDTAAWVVLLLMFELETYVLEDRHFTPPVKWSLHGLRVFCYTFIVYALYGYVVNLDFLAEANVVAGLSDLCTLAASTWSYAIDLDEYEIISAANCASLSESTSFLQIRDLPAVVDAIGLRDIRTLAWVDVINASVWVLVVIMLELDVRLQERGYFEGAILKISNACKFVLYAILFVAAIYWGVKGDFVDFWDAFLWLVAFFFIEMNVVEWRQEIREEAEERSG